MKSFLIAATMAALVILSIPAVAQQTPKPNQTPTRLTLNCADFKRNDDGSWYTVRFTMVQNSSGGRFPLSNKTFSKREIILGGVDLADYLDQHCAPHSSY